MRHLRFLRVFARLGVALAVLALIAAAPGFGGQSAAAPAVNKTSDDVAINGYDTVAYFANGKAIKGSPDYAVRWQDALWYFANAEHQGLFKADPSRYAPQFGGWCAGGLALGAYYTVDPEAWVIVDGKLYLNHSRTGAERWAENRNENIAKAEAVWAERIEPR